MRPCFDRFGDIAAWLDGELVATFKAVGRPYSIPAFVVEKPPILRCCLVKSLQEIAAETDRKWWARLEDMLWAPPTPEEEARCPARSPTT